MDVATLLVNVGLFVATAGATAIAWWRAIAAGRAEAGAKAAEDAALRAWSDASSALLRANQVTDVRLRGDYAWTLLDIGSLAMSARLTGAASPEVDKMFSERSLDLAAKSFGVGDASTSEITAWVAHYSKTSFIGEPVDMDTWMRATQHLEQRIRLWYRDPDAAIEEISREALANKRQHDQPEQPPFGATSLNQPGPH